MFHLPSKLCNLSNRVTKEHTPSLSLFLSLSLSLSVIYHHHVHKIPPLAPILTHMSSHHNLPSSIFKSYFINKLLCAQVIQVDLAFIFSKKKEKKHIYISFLCSERHMTHRSHHSNNIRRRVQVMKLLVIPSFGSLLSFSFRYKYLPRHPVLEHP